MKFRTTSVMFVAALALATSVFAQSERPTTVSLAAGIASGGSDVGAALGGSVLVDLTEFLSVEGQGTYVTRGRGADALIAGGSLLVNLLRSSERVVPYAAIGGSVYHVSYDLGDPRFLGPVGSQFASGATLCPASGTGFGLGPGPGVGSGAGTCPGTAIGYWGVGDLPHFYARRLGSLAFPRGGAWETRSFTDPALSVGAGVRIGLTDRVVLRPDIRALVVFADGKTHTLGVFMANLGYRF